MSTRSYRIFLVLSWLVSLAALGLVYYGFRSPERINFINARTGLPERDLKLKDTETTRASLSWAHTGASAGSIDQGRPAVVTAWCPDCTKLEKALDKYGYYFYKDSVKSSDEGKDTLPIVRMRIRVNSSNPKDLSHHPVCDVIGRLIEDEKRAGGCIVQDEAEQASGTNLVSQWVRDRHG